MTRFLQEVSTRPVYDLAEQGYERYHGIMSPVYDEEFVRTYIHDQFIAGAEAYARFYTNYPYFAGLIKQGLALGGAAQGIPKTILDIGSGAGNSVIPLVEMFPESQIVASDLSLELLALLREAATERFPEVALELMQLNAEDLHFKAGTFDLVVGAAILHHLFEPEKTIEGCARVLKPGGMAVFFEPMQSANYLIRTFYAMLLKDPRSSELPQPLAKYLKRRIDFFDDRVTTDKALPRFKKMDDKWMFARSYFVELGEKYRFSACRFQPIGDTKKRLQSKIAVHMKGFGGSLEDLPGWFLEQVQEFDQHLPESMQQDIAGDSIVVFVK